MSAVSFGATCRGNFFPASYKGRLGRRIGFTSESELCWCRPPLRSCRSCCAGERPRVSGKRRRTTRATRPPRSGRIAFYEQKRFVRDAASGRCDRYCRQAWGSLFYGPTVHLLLGQTPTVRGQWGSKQRRQRASYIPPAPTTIRSSDATSRCVCTAGLPQRTHIASSW